MARSDHTMLHIKLPFFLRSWDRASLMYLSITTKMQRYTIFFIAANVLHVSGGFSAHHQEQAVRSGKNSTNTRCCVYSFELLMMNKKEEH